MPGYVVPSEKSLKSILEVIFGETLDVSAEDGADLAGRHAATYVNDAGDVVAICACDNPLVAYSGAALTLLPKDAADEMLAESRLSDVVLANFHEIMNICSRVLMSDHSGHLRLDKTLDPNAASGPIAGLNGDARIASFQLTIPNYGSGAIAFLVT